MSDEHRHVMIEGDTGPSVRGLILNKSDDGPLDLTGATIQFVMTDPDVPETPVVDAPASIEGIATDGQIRYDWLPGDTDTPGSFNARFKVTLGDGTLESYPKEGGPIRVLIRSALA